MKDGRNRGNHSHPNVKVLLYKRNPDPSRPTHYPVLTLRPDKGLGIQQVRLHEPEGNSTGEAYREIHAHDRSGKLHVEHNSAHRYRLCDLIALWSSDPRFRNIWRNTSAGGSVHVWIGKYHVHVPHIRLEDLLRIPLDHESSITICIEESVPV